MSTARERLDAATGMCATCGHAKSRHSWPILGGHCSIRPDASRADCPCTGYVALTAREFLVGARDEWTDECASYVLPGIPLKLVDALLAVLDRLAQREAEHAEYVRQIRAGELVTLDRFIGPAQVDVREVQDAIDAALGTVTP